MRQIIFSFLIKLRISYPQDIAANRAKSRKLDLPHGEPQALETEIWGKICPPSDQEAIV